MSTVSVPDAYRRLLDDAGSLAKKLKDSEAVPMELLCQCVWENSETLNAAKRRLSGLQTRRVEMRKQFEKNIESMRVYANGCMGDDRGCS